MAPTEKLIEKQRRTQDGVDALIARVNQLSTASIRKMATIVYVARTDRKAIALTQEELDAVNAWMDRLGAL